MTSKLNQGDCFNGSSASKPIHFFRIILPDTLLQGKLRIPAKFVKKYAEHLSNTMFLKLPNGAEWKVSLEKRDGSVWLHNGWKEFAEYHSLAHGHLLIFRYDGTSHFHVIICGLSTMEIDYPFNNNVDRKRANNSDEFQPCKMHRTNGNNRNESDSNFQDCKGVLKNPSEEERNIDEHTKRSSISNCGAHEAAGITSFTVIIKPKASKWSLNLPKGSLQGYIKPGGQNVTLLVGDRSWRVNFIHYPHKSYTSVSAGWSKFARQNNLREGDACLFELLNNGSGGDMVMKVSVSKLPKS